MYRTKTATKSIVRYGMSVTEALAWDSIVANGGETSGGALFRGWLEGSPHAEGYCRTIASEAAGEFLDRHAETGSDTDLGICYLYHAIARDSSALLTVGEKILMGEVS